MRTIALAVGVERNLFSTDHSSRSMAEGRAFLDRVPISPTDRERIAHANAERLFGPQNKPEQARTISSL